MPFPPAVAGLGRSHSAPHFQKSGDRFSIVIYAAIHAMWLNAESYSQATKQAHWSPALLCVGYSDLIHPFVNGFSLANFCDYAFNHFVPFLIGVVPSCQVVPAPCGFAFCAGVSERCRIDLHSLGVFAFWALWFHIACSFPFGAA
jgi:hypothetical protein